MPLYKPDHIFLDVNIPGMGGVAMTRELKKDPTSKAIPLALVFGKEQKAA